MSIMIATQIPLMLILGLLYHKLGQLRKQQMEVGASKPLPSKSPSSNQDGVSDNEDAAEMSELLASGIWVAIMMDMARKVRFCTPS